jgi:hypothetical protein
MSEHTIDGGNFVAGNQQGDPGKLKYLHTPDWQGKAFVGGTELRIDERACPGCAFPGAPEGKWPHTNDGRCLKFIGEVSERVRQQVHERGKAAGFTMGGAS